MSMFDEILGGADRRPAGALKFYAFVDALEYAELLMEETDG